MPDDPSGVPESPPLIFRGDEKPESAEPPPEDVDPETGEHTVSALRDYGVDEQVIHAFNDGLAMEAFRKTEAGARLLLACEQDMTEAASVFLHSDDLNTPDVKAAHLRGRAAVRCLEVIEQAITEGRQAEEQIQEGD